MGLRGVVFVPLLVLVLSCLSSNAQLEYGFYSQTCPQAEYIVQDEVLQAFTFNRGIAAGLLRMHFHDCFVRGCDGSVLIDSTSSSRAEKDSLINFPSLRGFEVIDSAKERLESACKGVVSCADILAFAARDSVAVTGGFRYEVEGGRRDGRVSLEAETFTNLPPPFADVAGLTQSFASKGLTQAEMVILSGAHTLGRSHCSSFTDRLYNFNSTFNTDPTLDPSYASFLKAQCPQNINQDNIVAMDQRTPFFMDTNYYSDIVRNRGLFTSDQTLMSNPSTASVVRGYSFGGFCNFDFARAMQKMGRIGVLTGNSGEIRDNCRVIN